MIYFDWVWNSLRPLLLITQLVTEIRFKREIRYPVHSKLYFHSNWLFIYTYKLLYSHPKKKKEDKHVLKTINSYLIVKTIWLPFSCNVWRIATCLPWNPTLLWYSRFYHKSSASVSTGLWLGSERRRNVDLRRTVAFRSKHTQNVFYTSNHILTLVFKHNFSPAVYVVRSTKLEWTPNNTRVG